MLSKKWSILIAVLVIGSTVLAACAPPEPEVVTVEVTKIVEGETVVEEVVVTATPEAAEPEKEMRPNVLHVGDMAYDIESGILTSWFKNSYDQYPTEVFPVHPDFVGHRAPKILMGKYSGLDNLIVWTKKLGIELDENEAMDVLKQVKQRSHDLKRPLTEDEFRGIVQGVKAG